MSHRLLAAAVALLVTACGSPPANNTPEPVIVDDVLPDAGTPEPDAGVPPPGFELGMGDHEPKSVKYAGIAFANNGLKTPRDLDFNPRKPNELWVLNYDDDSVLIIHDTSLPTMRHERRKDAYALHFMAEPAAIAFGADPTTAPVGKPGTFATCGESRNTYDGHAAHNDFMGPALWSSDLSIFAMSDPHGLGTHLDMLHHSPLCMGIAHQKDNEYWVFGGLSNSLYWYNFKNDHGIGLDDHTDGEAKRYVEGKVKYVAGVPSHLTYNHADAMLYVADTGNSRIAKLDTKSGTRGANLPSMEPQVFHYRMDNAVISDVVPASSGLLKKPSGLELHKGLLYVSDNETSIIHAFTLDGQQVNYLKTGLPAGSLGGIKFGPDGKLYFVDMKGHRVIRIDP